MRINDASNKELSLYHDALWLVDADTTTWEFVDFVRSANFALDAVLRKILPVNGRWQYADSNNTKLGVATTDLVSGQTNYSLDDKYLKVRRVRVYKDGQWYTLDPKDKRDLTDAELNESGTPTCYDKVGRSLFPYPVPNFGGTGALELTFQKGSNYFSVSDTTKEPGFDEIFHRYISLYPSREYAMKYAQDKVKIIDVFIERLDEEIKEHFTTRDQDEAPHMTTERTLSVSDAGL